MANKGAIILAAGYSSRMGEFKPLMPVGEMAALERIIGVAKAAGIEHIVIVTGHDRERLRHIIEREGVSESFNPDYDLGMFTSIQAGIKGLEYTNADGFFLIPVDCAALSVDVLNRMLSECGVQPDCFLVPCYYGKKGHPLWIPKIYAKEIIHYQGRNGLKGLIDLYEDKLVRIETGSESVILDMDDRAGYEELVAYLQRDGKEEDLQTLAKGRTLYFIRHGQIRQHDEKIFLGQYDVPLSDIGRMQAKEAGELLGSYAPETDVVYSSSLLRAAETAEIIVGVLGRGEVVKSFAFSEMSLGAWDGQAISYIQKRYPLEYEKRGKNLLTYKFDHQSENFYDLQYRVIKELKRILKEDRQKDIVIVSHAGVISAAIERLAGRQAEKKALGSITVVEL